MQLFLYELTPGPVGAASAALSLVRLEDIHGRAS